MNVLIVDDEPKLAGLLKSRFEMQGHQALATENGDEAVELSRQHPLQLILMDLSVKGRLSDKALLAELKKVSPQVPVVVITGNLEAEEPDFQQLGAAALLRKPIDLSGLDEIVKRVCGSAAA